MNPTPENEYNLTRFFQLQSGLAQYQYTVTKQNLTPEQCKDNSSTIPLKQKITQISEGIQLDFIIILNNEEITLSNQIIFYDTTPVKKVEKNEISSSQEQQQQESIEEDKMIQDDKQSTHDDSAHTTPMNSPFFTFTNKNLHDEDTFMHLDIQQDSSNHSHTSYNNHQDEDNQNPQKRRRRQQINYTNMSPLPYLKKQSLFYDEKLQLQVKNRISPKKKSQPQHQPQVQQASQPRVSEPQIQPRGSDLMALYSTKRTDKKNVVKNFIKAFRGFVLNTEKKEVLKGILGYYEDSQIVEFQKEFIIFEKQNHYNNKFMRDLICDKVYNRLFAYFLENEALSWLENSLVHDKEGHKVMLSFYIKACQNPSFLDRMKVLKKEENLMKNSNILLNNNNQDYSFSCEMQSNFSQVV